MRLSYPNQFEFVSTSFSYFGLVGKRVQPDLLVQLLLISLVHNKFGIVSFAEQRRVK